MAAPSNPRRRSTRKSVQERQRDLRLNLRSTELAKDLLARVFKNTDRLHPNQVAWWEKNFATMIRSAWGDLRVARQKGREIRRNAVQDRVALRANALKRLLELKGFKDVEILPANSPENVFGGFDAVSITVGGKPRPDLEAKFKNAFIGLEERYERELLAKGGTREPTRKVVGWRDRTRRAMERLIQAYNESFDAPEQLNQWIKEKWIPSQKEWFKTPEQRAYFLQWIARNEGRLKRQMLSRQRKNYSKLIGMIEGMFD